MFIEAKCISYSLPQWSKISRWLAWYKWSNEIFFFILV